LKLKDKGFPVYGKKAFKTFEVVAKRERKRAPSMQTCVSVHSQRKLSV